jgi:bla regulator protein BlaR1
MNAVLWWLGQNTIAVAVMLPFVLIGCWAFRSRPAVQHVLWLVLLVKFLMPPVFETPWSVESLMAMWAPPPPAVTEPTSLDMEFALEVIDVEPVIADAAVEETAVVEPAITLAEVAEAAVVLWIIGCVVAFLVQLRRIERHRKLIRGGALAPRHLENAIGQVSLQMGLRPIRAIVVRRIASPFVWCFGWLRLVWPEALLGESDVSRSRGMIAHEMAHIRRRDHWVAWLEFAAGLIWWWNPLFWFVRRRLREAAELACDALAIGALPDERRAYAEMFLELSSSFKSGTPAPVLGMSAGAPSSFERRLTMILSERVSGKMSWAGFLLAGLVALAAAPSLTLGQPGRPPAPPPLTDFEKRLLHELQQREAATKAHQADNEMAIRLQVAETALIKAEADRELARLTRKQSQAQGAAEREQSEARLRAAEAQVAIAQSVLDQEKARVEWLAREQAKREKDKSLYEKEMQDARVQLEYYLRQKPDDAAAKAKVESVKVKLNSVLTESDAEIRRLQAIIEDIDRLIKNQAKGATEKAKPEPTKTKKLTDADAAIRAVQTREAEAALAEAKARLQKLLLERNAAGASGTVKILKDKRDPQPGGSESKDKADAVDAVRYRYVQNKERLNKLVLEEKSLSTDLGGDHPKVRAKRHEIEALQADINKLASEVQANAQALKQKLSALRYEEEAIRQLSARAAADQAALQARQRETADLLKQKISALQNKLEEFSQTNGGEHPSVLQVRRDIDHLKDQLKKAADQGEAKAKQKAPIAPPSATQEEVRAREAEAAAFAAAARDRIKQYEQAYQRQLEATALAQ